MREGLRPEGDAIPRRLIEEAVPEGMLAGQTVDWELMRSEFYAASGLDPATSLPTPETLARLGLEWVRRRSDGRGSDAGGDVVSGYSDFREYIAALDDAGLLRRVKSPICKDTELMPLVRLQFRGLPAEERTAFLFEQVTDATGRQYPGPVAVGVMGANREVYAKALGCAPDDIAERWAEVHGGGYIEPVLVDDGPVLEEIHVGDDLLEHDGILEFPHPISTPGLRPGAVLHLALLGDQGPGDRRAQRRHLPRDGQGAGARRDDGPPVAAHRPPPPDRAQAGRDARGGHHRRLRPGRRPVQRGQDPLRRRRVRRGGRRSPASRSSS